MTTHPALRHGVETIAALYDMQHAPALREEMTYISPTSGEPVGLSFIIPRTRAELEQRRVMMLHWARRSCGMMGRSPDFMNVTFAAWAAAEFFAKNRPEFADNLQRYYEYIRENDLTLTHALINLQRSRTVTGVPNLSDAAALHVVRETDAVLSCAAPVFWPRSGRCRTRLPYSPRLARLAEGHSPYALNFAIPCGTPGVKFSVATVLIWSARTLTIPQDRASKRWIVWSSLRMCLCPGSASFFWAMSR